MWNNFQIYPRQGSNTGSSDLCSNTLPPHHGSARDRHWTQPNWYINNNSQTVIRDNPENSLIRYILTRILTRQATNTLHRFLPPARCIWFLQGSVYFIDVTRLPLAARVRCALEFKRTVTHVDEEVIASRSREPSKKSYHLDGNVMMGFILGCQRSTPEPDTIND